MAGRDFVKGFLKHNPRLSHHKPEGVTLNRVFGLNKTSVDRYFDNLQSLLEKHNFEPHQIYNCNESSLTCVRKLVKVVAPKSKRVVSSTTSDKRGQTTTIVNCCSASGDNAPPIMIYKKKRLKAELLDHAPA